MIKESYSVSGPDMSVDDIVIRGSIFDFSWL